MDCFLNGRRSWNRRVQHHDGSHCSNTDTTLSSRRPAYSSLRVDPQSRIRCRFSIYAPCLVLGLVLSTRKVSTRKNPWRPALPNHCQWFVVHHATKLQVNNMSQSPPVHFIHPFIISIELPLTTPEPDASASPVQNPVDSAVSGK